MNADADHFFTGAQPLALFANEARKQQFVQTMVQPTFAQGDVPALHARIQTLGTVAYASRGVTLLSGFSVLENISLPLLHRLSITPLEILRRCRLLSRFAGIAPALLKRDAAGLGALEKIQACFLQAAAGEPGLLVLDAVFDALPPPDQQRVAAMVQGYRRLYPLRCILLLGYAAPPPHLYLPTSVIDEAPL